LQTFTTEVLLPGDDPRLAFLPEGPIATDRSGFSWVSIQHAAESQKGSLNLFDWQTKTNVHYELHGRPGFAFATDRPGNFVAGIERSLCLVNVYDGSVVPLSDEIDVGVENTLINDGVAFEKGIVFGAKDLEFKTKKAGLYFWRYSDRQLIQLRDDQICSNGKVITGSGDQWCLLDIDTPTQQVVRYQLNTATGVLSEPETVLDFTQGDIFPDGMIATDDPGSSVIVAFYNPDAAEYGVARQFCIATGVLEAQWQTIGAPRVTCPLLMPTSQGTKLVLTTATEGMADDMYAEHPHSGSLFVGETNLGKVSLQAPIPIKKLGFEL